MSNPFDDENGIFSVLVNEERQHCLWPEAVPVAAGWRVALPAVPRAEALAYVEANWHDLRPSGLASKAGIGRGR